MKEEISVPAIIQAPLKQWKMKLKKKSLKESNKCCPELFIVDDDEINILALSMMLKNLGV